MKRKEEKKKRKEKKKEKKSTKRDLVLQNSLHSRLPLVHSWQVDHFFRPRPNQVERIEDNTPNSGLRNPRIDFHLLPLFGLASPEQSVHEGLFLRQGLGTGPFNRIVDSHIKFIEIGDPQKRSGVVRSDGRVVEPSLESSTKASLGMKLRVEGVLESRDLGFQRFILIFIVLQLLLQLGYGPALIRPEKGGIRKGKRNGEGEKSFLEKRGVLRHTELSLVQLSRRTLIPCLASANLKSFASWIRLAWSGARWRQQYTSPFETTML